jgi:heat shock protein HslJ
MVPQRLRSIDGSTQRSGALRLLACLLPIALAAGGCAVPPASDPPAGHTVSIEQRGWRLLAFAHEGELRAAAPEITAELRFQDGDFAGTLGCNRIRGRYRLDGDRLMVAPDIASTLMACPEPAMRQERAALAALERARRVEVGAETLALLDEAGAVVLRFDELRPLPLAGTLWQALAFNNGRGGVESLVADSAISLRFDTEGQFAGRACNRFHGTVEIAGDALRVATPIGSTRLHCASPEGVMEQERLFLEALARTTRFRIEGPRLTLLDDAGAVQARFVGAP